MAITRLLARKRHFPPSLRIPKLHAVGIEIAGLMWEVIFSMLFKPCNMLPVFRTLGIGEYLEMFIVAWYSSADFRWARSSAVSFPSGGTDYMFNSIFQFRLGGIQSGAPRSWILETN